MNQVLIDRLKSPVEEVICSVEGVEGKPRVLFVSPVSDKKGGAERVLLELLSNRELVSVLAVPEYGELSKFAQDHDVPVGCYYPTALVQVHRPLRLRRMVAAVVDSFRCARRLSRMARAQRCDLIHTNGLKAHVLGAIVSILFRARVIVHLHDIPYSGPERLIWRLIGACVARVIIVSEPCWPGPRAGAVAVLPNPVWPISAELRQSKGPQSLRLGFVGRYHPHKGMDLLLDWIKAASIAGLKFNLVLRGRPDSDHPAYWSRIRHRIQAEDLASLVEDQGWQESGAAYDDLDFLLVPSELPDPAPLVIPEAMTAGVVVIGYPAGGVPGLIPAGTGMLARTPVEFVDALRSCLESPYLYQAIRKAAYLHVRDANDPASVARQFADICLSAWKKP